MVQKNTKLNKGFTIIELLVVIVVIGILAAISVVSYTGVTKAARDNAAKTAAYAVRDAANMYQSQSSTGYYPATAADFSKDFDNIGMKLPASSFIATIDSAKPEKVQYFKCSDTAASLAEDKITGYKIVYYNSTANVTVAEGGTTTCSASAITP